MTEAEEFDGSGTLILSPAQLKKGMYVSYLDRPWTDSPFPFQGFLIESEKELEKLRDVCEYVFVDGRRGEGADYLSYNEQRGKKAAQDAAAAAVAEDCGAEQDNPPTEDEFPQARKAYAAFKKAMIDVYQVVARGGAADLTRLDTVAAEVINSVRRNPDALLYFVRTQTDGDYLFRHGVACAVMGCALGKSMGLSYSSLKTLTLGGALLDIGKTRVPSELLNRPSALELTPGELQQLRRHVDRGAEVLAPATSEGGPLVTMIMTHHERYDGSGYPRGLAGDLIPRFGKIASIIDMFDAMVSERSYGRRATPYEAMRYIKSQRGEAFDPKLVEAFRRAFGTYPTGTLVELASGEVGFVIQQNPRARLQPRVYILLDKDKQRVNEFKVIDLYANKKCCVVRSLRAGSYGIDF